jgi:hypothetical protein
MTIPPETQQEGLSQEEQDFLLGRTPRPQRRTERRRPGWLVVGLVWATFGLYVILWVGLHWAEMKRHLRDDRMYPVWHALTMLVPIYSFFRFHANFRVLNELLATERTDHRVRPMVAVATFLLASLLLTVPVEDTALVTLNLMGAIAAISWIIHHGQTGMNEFWDSSPDVDTTDHVKLWERLVVSFGAALWSLMILGLFIVER